MFQFRLTPLLNYREHRRDLCRQILAQAFAEEARLLEQKIAVEAERGALLDEIRVQTGLTSVPVRSAMSRRYYAGDLQAILDDLGRQVVLVKQQQDYCRQALVLADREVKMLEQLREKSAAEYAAGAIKKESRDLEEAWQAGVLSRRAS